MRKIISVGLTFIFLYIPWFNGGEGILSRSLIPAIILILSIFYLAKRGNFDSLFSKFYISSSLHFPICLFLFFSLFSVVNSTYLHNSVLSFIRIITSVLFYFLLVEHLSDKGILTGNYLFKIIFVCASIFAAVGLLQSFLHLEIKATLPTSDFLAGYLAVGITLGMVELLTCRRWSGSNRTKIDLRSIIAEHRVTFAFYLISTLLMSICLVLTRSLSGLLALLAAVIFVTIFLYRKRAVSVIFTVIAIFLIFPSTIRIFQLIGGENLKEFFLQRMATWSQGLEIISIRPFLGLGPGNFNFPSGYGEYMRFVNNEYLQIGAELGMIVLFLLGSIFYISAKGVKKLLSSNLSLKSQSEVVAASAGALVILTQGLFYSNLHLPAVTYILVFFVAEIVIEAQKLFPCQISPNEQPGSIFKPKAPGWLRVTSIAISSLLLLLVLAIYLGNHHAEKGEYRKAVKFVPLNAEYHKELADQYRKENKQDRILSIYEKIVKLNPTKADYHEQLGHIYHKLGDQVSALREFELAVKYNPYSPFFHFLLGSYYLDRKEFGKARIEYQKVVDIEPCYLLARLRLGESYLGLEESKRAKEEFYKLLKLKELLPKSNSSERDHESRLFEFDYSSVYVGLGRCWMEEGNPIQAITECRKALEMNPISAGAHSGLADVYFIQKRYDLAIDEIRRAIELDPQNELYRMELKLIEDTVSGVELPSE